MTVRRLAALSAVLASMLTASVATAPAVATGPTGANPVPATVKVLQLNICHSGIMDCYTGEAVLAKAVAGIRVHRPAVLSVNEACSGDADVLREAMGPATTVFVAAERPNGARVLCANGQQFGNLLMVAEALAGGTGITGRYAAQDTSNEMRVWACLPAGGLTACTTHLSARSGSIAMAQCRELMSRAVDYATRSPVVVSGDLNLSYQGNPNVQNCNPAGFYRKGDGAVQHVFATTSLAFVSGTRISMAGTTDHPAWLVTVTMS